MSAEPRIGYLVGLFPKLSETFVLNEVVHLRRRGLDLVPISFDRSSRLEARTHGAAREVGRAIVYPPDVPRARLMATVAAELLRHPVRVWRLFRANARLPVIRGDSRLGRFALSLETARLARRLDLQHLHAHWTYPCDVALLISPYLGVPFSFTAHASDVFEDVPEYAAQGFEFAERVAAARFVLACTEFNREHLRELSRPEDREKIQFAYHGLDVTRFRPRPGTNGQGPPVILSVGRFVPAKGFDVIVRACALLHSSATPFRCRLVGPEGAASETVRQEVAKAGLEGIVELPGPRTQEELIGEYAGATIYVNSSNPDLEYGVANVIVEALAMGKPTIATHRPQVAEYVRDGDNGLLVPFGDEEALAAAMRSLLADPTLRARLGERGRREATERFDIERTTDFLDDLFRREIASAA